jgi:hypothetical protein
MLGQASPDWRRQGKRNAAHLGDERELVLRRIDEVSEFPVFCKGDVVAPARLVDRSELDVAVPGPELLELLLAVT